MKTIVLRLAQQTRQNLEIVASATGRDPSDIVAEAVEEYVTKELALLVESHRQEVEAPMAGGAASGRFAGPDASEQGDPVRIPRLGRKKI